MKDATKRFSNRVVNYIRYRPDYPREILDLLQTECGLGPDSIVADVGAGTGILSSLFLSENHRVFAIEPNQEMREAADKLLGADKRYCSLPGCAEATGLPDRSVDFVTAGQAFHWFDPVLTRQEFVRILRPSGWIVLIWNDRRTDSTPFLAAYEALLRAHATDYDQVNHKRIDEQALRSFFQGTVHFKSFPNFQTFEFTSLQGRLLSSSYVPERAEPGYAAMIQALECVFSEHQDQGKVTFEYDTIVYYGRLD